MSFVCKYYLREQITNFFNLMNQLQTMIIRGLQCEVDLKGDNELYGLCFFDVFKTVSSLI